MSQVSQLGAQASGPTYLTAIFQPLLYIFFSEISLMVISLFLNQVVFLLLSFKNSFYILDEFFMRCVFFLIFSFIKI